MEILHVQDLCKTYPGFSLKNVSFSLEEGSIMGFIGRNGAGKTTTLKSMLNLVHSDTGLIRICGMDFRENEFACKQSMGWVLGGVDYYPKRKLKAIADVVGRFYDGWDSGIFSQYLSRFDLNSEKRVDELSAGMRVKFALAMALSHKARLLILDEPTSGLDPVSRDDLLELFESIVAEGGHSILFSTHITTDLEKCADKITYIREGEIIATGDLVAFVNDYRMLRGTEAQINSPSIADKIIGTRKNAFGYEGLIKTCDLPDSFDGQIAPASLEDIMVHIERK